MNVGILGKNLMAIKTYKKYLTNIYSVKNSHNKCSDAHYELHNEYALDGCKFMYIDDGTRVIRINSMYSPQNEARYWAKNITDGYNNMLITCLMFGFGNGYFVRAILNSMDENDVIIIYEPSIKIFKNTLEQYDISDIVHDERILLLVGNNSFKEYVNSLHGTVRAENVVDTKMAIHPYYDRLYPIEKKAFVDITNKHMMDCIVMKNTYNVSGRKMVENELFSLNNLKSCMSMYDLKESIHQIEKETAIIVSAGPSLVKNMKTLKLVKNNGCIIAVDRIANVLLENDIIPDVIISIDSRYPIEKFADERWKNITLMCDFISNIEVIKAHPNRRIYIGNPRFIRGMFDEIGKKYPQIARGGSVATAATSVCAELGFKNIILCGQDLAYGEGDITHADGLHEDNLTSSGKDIYVEDIYGNKVRSRWDWTMYRYFFEQMIAGMPQINFIDATEGGAKIKGTRIMTLKDAIAEYCTSPSKAKKIFNNPATTITDEDVEAINRQLEQFKSDIDDIRLVCDDALNALDIILTDIDEDNYEDDSEIVKEFQSKIDAFNEFRIAKMIVTYSGEDIKDSRWSLFVGKKDNTKSIRFMYEKYKDMFKGIIKSLPEISGFLMQ